MIWLAVLILFFSWAVPQPVPDEKELLREGLRLEQNGQYEPALRVWAEALTTLEKPSLAIGRAHIRLATEQQLSSHYQLASTLYLWGLSAEEIETNKPTLKKEIEMLRPVAGKQIYEQWRKLLNQGDSSLYQQMHFFWQNQDPTPATTYNERLIEHWERISYARENFTRKNDPPYGTDERGEYWVRYGTPDRQYDGQLKATRGQVSTVCMELSCNSEIMGNAVLELDQRPYYNIWIYEKPNKNMKYNLVLIFGEDPTSGFGRIEILEDFIPNRAFTFSNRYSAPSLLTESAGKVSDVMTPGMVMQWIYYKQLTAKDFYFANIFNEVDFVWNRVGPNPAFDKHAGHVQEQQTQMVTIRNMQAAPEEVSTYEKEFPSIPLQVFQYRLLNMEGRPVFATFLQSWPQPVFVGDLAANEDSMAAGLSDSATVGELFAHYELIHGMQLKDPEDNILSQHRMQAELLLDSTNTLPSSTVFTIPHVADNTKQLLYAELHNRHPNSRPRVETPFPNSLRGLGRLEIEQSEPLSADPEQLEMSDLILGYQMQEAEGNTLFPFVVANDKKIPKDEDLAVHVETYHLQTDPAGIARFQLHYEILPVNWLGWSQEHRQEFSLTLNLEIDSNRYAEDLEIQTRVLEPGRYVLRIQATQGSGQQVKRKIEFEVME